MAEVLIAGAEGGRERALEQAMLASPEVDRVEVATDIQEGVDRFSVSEKPFVIIGPEIPLIEGAADELRLDGYTVLGASKSMASYEASKSKTVKLARKIGATHPATHIAYHNFAKQQFVRTHEPKKYIIKADEVAAGTGVIVAETKQQACEIIEGLTSGELAKGAGKKIINFASRRSGPEVSPMVLVGADENDIQFLPFAQDHKRLLDGDAGPNTGGMGAYSPIPDFIVNNKQNEQIKSEVKKILRGMREAGADIRGSVFYPAYMMDEELDGAPTLLEINTRFGDPEAQVVLRRLVDAGVDVYRLLRSTAEGSIERPDIDLGRLGGAAITIALTAEGYGVQDYVRKEDVIYGLDKKYQNVAVQLASAKEIGDKWATNGGRVLFVTSSGETLDEAARFAYSAIGKAGIHFAGMHYRQDIGWQARSK